MEIVTVNSDNKDSTYVATSLLFNNIRSMALVKLCNWELVESYTNNDEQHFITKYSNGKMWIKAVSVEQHHIYTFGPENA